MSRCVRLFTLPATGETRRLTLRGPIVHVAHSNLVLETIEIWAEFDTNADAETCYFRTFQTGEYLPRDASYVATVPRSENGGVIHLFEIRPDQLMELANDEQLRVRGRISRTVPVDA